MAERKTATRRISSDLIQGEGSYVVLRNLKVDQALDFIKTTAARNAIEVQAEFLAGRVVEWNWVDDQGAPLAQPGEDANVLRALTLQEQAWLVAHLFARPEAERKN